MTLFLTDEKCFWHSGGNYALTAPVGGLVQPLAAGGLPESPETKRRLRNLIDVTGLAADLTIRSAPAAPLDDLLRVHPQSYLTEFAQLSAQGGGELGERTPFGPGGYDIAALSAGLVTEAVRSVLAGEARNAYALSRPPGHHCLPDYPMGFCLLANIAIAIRSAASDLRVAVVDWDVHHGNGTEAIFADDSNVLTLSVHQDGNYPWTTGGVDTAAQANINIPLPPGSGHKAYLRTMDRIVLPALKRFRPDLIIVACGFDASGVDPLARMLAGSDTFGLMTAMLMRAADTLCEGRLAMAHEGGYSEVHVPFCGHAVLAQMSGSKILATDPLAARIAAHQPSAHMDAVHEGLIDELAAHFAAVPL
ncbi:class II histone deacetylase [Pontivivens insulae]|uniref:Histone deacetylase-like amidohydrolase n=1 Tax=Pontivivens insulae TaxID=1639689 RepID=A0A2R8A8S1_9RHOB|nr:class II histone deacetylase [Pontivivens insulae]RED18728.1 acetoin utilization deacetylase AcuC-like enzyme [Pontivivens insulae]SPF28626.1 Histone deacetylase-like amidohydrolase [Pontivivens insulae]